ncbi:MAG: alpha/beta fold hydrolase [Nevskiales bacterium]|nr:alpha/beta fold hydrolase [Nevskiales bacterium]
MYPTNTPLRAVPADYHPPGSARWFKLHGGPDAGKTLFYSDHSVSAAAAQSTVVFVHGNPECSYTYRHIRDRLISNATPCRIIANDHIGFGLSDQASYEMVDMHHAANLSQLIRHLDLRKVTLVVHDWGGPIGIGAFIDEPDRVERLLVMNSTVFPMPPDGLTYENYPFPILPWCRTADLIPARLWGAVAAYVVSHASPQGFLPFMAGVSGCIARAITGSLTRRMDTPESVWCAQFGTRINALSSQRNVRQTPVWGHGYRYTDATLGPQDNRAFYAKIQSRIAAAWGENGRNIDAAGYFGGWDPCGKDAVVAQWQQALPRMREATFRFPDVGHFIEEYKGAEMADTLHRMITGAEPGGQ